MTLPSHTQIKKTMQSLSLDTIINGKASGFISMFLKIIREAQKNAAIATADRGAAHSATYEIVVRLADNMIARLHPGFAYTPIEAVAKLRDQICAELACASTDTTAAVEAAVKGERERNANEVEKPVNGVEVHTFNFGGVIAKTVEGYTKFMSTVDVSDLLRARAAAIRKGEKT